MSTETKELFEDLIKAQAELENIKNSATNPFYHSSYSPLDVILKNIRPVLAKYNLGVVHDFTGNSDAIIVSSMIIHKSGQWIEQTGLPIPLIKKDAQTACGAVTFGRRYTVLALLDIVGENEDDDGNGASGKDDKVKPVKQKGKIKPLLDSLNKAENIIKINNLLSIAKERTWTPEEQKEINDLAELRKKGFENG